MGTENRAPAVRRIFRIINFLHRQPKHAAGFVGTENRVFAVRRIFFLVDNQSTLLDVGEQEIVWLHCDELFSLFSFGIFFLVQRAETTGCELFLLFQFPSRASTCSSTHDITLFFFTKHNLAAAAFI